MKLLLRVHMLHSHPSDLLMYLSLVSIYSQANVCSGSYKTLEYFLKSVDGLSNYANTICKDEHLDKSFVHGHCYLDSRASYHFFKGKIK